MAAYFILTHTITDLETYRGEYIPQALPFIAKYGGEIIVASPDAEPLQGNPEKGVVVLRFPSEEAVRGFVNDPEYQPAKELRIALTTNAHAVLAPEFQIPFLVPMCIAEISSTDVAPTWPITMRSSALSISSTFSTPA